MSGFLGARLDEVEAVMAKEMSKSGATFDLEIPSFRIKRSHKKSRLGCVNCKRRRVKVSGLLKQEIRPSGQHTYEINSATRSSLAAIGKKLWVHSGCEPRSVMFDIMRAID